MRTLSLSKPNSTTLRDFVAEQAALDFTYAAVGATRATPPAGFIVDRTRVELGTGEATFLAAKAALQEWRQLRLGWVDVWPPEAPLAVGQVVAIMGWAVGLWWLNSCRLIYSVDESGPTDQRFGFAYGTLPGHVESGEERFQIEWNRHTDRVSYDILAFSRPNHFLTRLGYPLVRQSQKRFGRDSAAAMFRIVHPSAALPAILQVTE